MHRKIQYAVVGLAIGVILLGCAFAASNNTEAVNASDERVAITTATPKGTEKPEITHLLYTTTDAPTTTNEPTPDPDEEDIEMLAKLIWGEARGVESTTEKAAVVWCVLNRVDAKGYPNTIAEVVTQRKQFVGYDADYPATETNKLIAEDVLRRWYAEKTGITNVGRILPKDYIYFTGDGKQNHFTSEWKSDDTWDWSLPSPYEN